MASTPPLQLLSSPPTPSTPLHGAKYERPTRQSSRIKQRAASHAQTPSNHRTATPPRQRSVTSPTSASQSLHRSLSPRVTPKKSVRRVQVVSPPSPNSEPTSFKPSITQSQPYPSSSITFSEGMLPTPVKTPKKKNIHNIQSASKALFQDPTTIEEMAKSAPNKSRKTKRFNGYSLESFRADVEEPKGVQVFTDNRDQVPEVDDSPSNPFYDATSNTPNSRASKRRKVSASTRKDHQVEDVIREGEGMVYVFRGRKVFRRFEDAGEEEEVIDPDDLGLLTHAADGSTRTQPMRTLTRKSIKPKRLFESAEDKAKRELEKEEEALTDVDEREFENEVSAVTHKSVKITGSTIEKKTSPFDKWPRLKKGSREGSATKATKRSAAEALNGSPADTEIKTSKRKVRA